MHNILGMVIVGVSSFFREISTSIGKKEMEYGHESIHVMGFLGLSLVSVMFFAIALVTEGGIHIAKASVPLFGLRVFLDIIVTTVSLHAIKTATRSTFNFFRMTTIPLIVLVDILVGYTLSTQTIVGIAIILLVIAVLYLSQSIQRKGAHLVVLQATLAVATISLFKYSIENYNTVASEQFISTAIQSCYFFVMAFIVRHEKFSRAIFSRKHLLQSVFSMFSSGLLSYAIMFTSPAIFITTKRASDLVTGIVSGNLYFHEKHMKRKVIGIVCILAGLVLIAVT